MYYNKGSSLLLVLFYICFFGKKRSPVVQNTFKKNAASEQPEAIQSYTHSGKENSFKVV
jgi:hypothetical protein